MIILDTNVLSALRRPDKAPSVRHWLERQAEADLYLSVITIGEIERGIGLQARRDPGLSEQLRRWLNLTQTLYADRILPFTVEDARIWASLSARLGHPGADLMIAASALARGASIATRNVPDFEGTGVQVIDPFE